MPLILNQVCYGSRVKKLSFTWHEGEFIGVVGGNGAGKSTLAQLLIGALLPDHGEVRLDMWHTHIPAERRVIQQRVALVGSNPEAQIVAPTVREEISFGLRAEGLPIDIIHERVDAALDEFDLVPFADVHPFTLSAGEMCRVMLASQCVRRPQWLILDEFTHMLDSIIRFRLLEWLRDYHLQTGTAILLITHRLEELRHSDRALVLVEGALAADLSIPDFYRQLGAHPKWYVELPMLMRLAHECNDPRLAAWR